MIPTLPLRLRNRLTAIILAALHDGGARRKLATLASPGAAAGQGWPVAAARSAQLLADRARRASDTLAGRPLRPASGSLPEALGDAAALFDGHLYFEAHELLEPHWRLAEGEAKEALRGLIQIAVGYQHLANGNLGGGRALLEEGAERLHGRRLERADLESFAGGVLASAGRLAPVDWGAVPAFPRGRA